MNENQKTLESLEIVKQALEYLKKNKNDFLNKYLNGFEKQDANGLDNIDSMTPFEFENYIKEIFKQKGYNSRLTEKYPSEYGADVIAIKDNEIIAIQCKHSSKQNIFGREAIHQLHCEAKDFHKATKLIAVTNSFFNSNAMNLAKVHNIEIINRNNILYIFN